MRRYARPAAACTRCVEGMPNGRLRGDYTIDATRCIADLTQRTDPIPREMRPPDRRLGLGLRYLPDGLSPDEQGQATRGERGYSFLLTQRSLRPSLTELLQLRSGEFKRRYALVQPWVGAEPRCCAATQRLRLGNALDRSAIPALAAALTDDPHPMVRGAAAWALGRIGAPRAIDALRTREAFEPDPTVRRGDCYRTAMKTFAKFGLFVALGCALPLRTAAADDLLSRMSTVNPELHSYTATLRAHVALITFPFIATDIVATYYIRTPTSISSRSRAACRSSRRISRSSSGTWSRRRDGTSSTR